MGKRGREEGESKLKIFTAAFSHLTCPLLLLVILFLSLLNPWPSQLLHLSLHRLSSSSSPSEGHTHLGGGSMEDLNETIPYFVAMTLTFIFSSHGSKTEPKTPTVTDYLKFT